MKNILIASALLFSITAHAANISTDTLSADVTSHNENTTKILLRIGAIDPSMSMTGEGTDVISKNEKMSPRISTGIAVRLPISNAFSIEPGIQYSQKGMNVSTAENIDFGSGISGLLEYKYSFKMSYLELPIMLNAHLNLSKNNAITFSIGPSIGYLMSASSAGTFCFQGQCENQPSTNVDLSNANRFEFSGIAGLGYSYQFSRHFGIGLEGRYQMGLTSISSDANDSAKNRGVLALANLIYAL